jgi:hypothetical protein
MHIQNKRGVENLCNDLLNISAAMEQSSPEPPEVDYSSLEDPFLTELYRQQPSTAS